MRIVYCLQALHRSGGIERVVTTKANHWAGRGDEVTIITTDQRSQPMAFGLDSRVKHIDLGLDYEADNALGRWRRLRALWHKRRLHRERLMSVLNDLRADIVVSTGFQDATLLPGMRDGSKKILESHSSKYTKVLMYPPSAKFWRFVGKWRIWQEERLASRYDRFVILTEEERQDFVSLRNLEVIPNPIPFSSSELVADSSARHIISVGRFEYQKNFLELINIWSKVAPLYPDWHLHIVGEGYLRESMQSRIENLGLSGQTTLHPATPAIKEMYLRSSIYVLTSHYEGLPMVLIEAQAMGLPVVAYACPSGPRDIVEEGKTGYLVEPYDQASFVACLEALMGNESQRKTMGCEAQRGVNKFALPMVMKRWEDLFAQLM